MMKKKTISLMLAAALVLASGCSYKNDAESVSISITDDNSNGTVTVENNSDKTVTVTKTVTADMAEKAAKVNDGETITKAGTYILEGEYTHTVTIDADKEDDVILILNGATVTSGDGPAVSAVKCNSLIISVAAGTTNTLTDAKEYADTSEAAPTGALYSKNNLTIEGEGTLIVNGNAKHGIVSKDNLYINGAIIELTASKDGLHAGEAMEINGGTINIKDSNEGMEAESVTVNNGIVIVNAKDDGINATSDEVTPVITFNGGTVTVNSAGDGVDSNGNIVLNGGFVYVSGATNDGNAAMDYDGTFTANGGTLISSGMSGMYQSISKESGNKVIDYIGTETVKAGTTVSLYDKDTLICSTEIIKDANAILITSDALENGKEYTLKLGDKSVSVTAGESTNQGFGGFGGFGGKGGFGPGGNKGEFNGQSPNGNFDKREAPEGSQGEPPEGFNREKPEGFGGNFPGDDNGNFGGEPPKDFEGETLSN